MSLNHNIHNARINIEIHRNIYNVTHAINGLKMKFKLTTNIPKTIKSLNKLYGNDIWKTERYFVSSFISNQYLEKKRILFFYRIQIFDVIDNHYVA